MPFRVGSGPPPVVDASCGVISIFGTGGDELDGGEGLGRITVFGIARARWWPTASLLVIFIHGVHTTLVSLCS